eukprot:gene13093-8939_t
MPQRPKDVCSGRITNVTRKQSRPQNLANALRPATTLLSATTNPAVEDSSKPSATTSKLNALKHTCKYTHLHIHTNLTVNNNPALYPACKAHKINHNVSVNPPQLLSKTTTQQQSIMNKIHPGNKNIEILSHANRKALLIGRAQIVVNESQQTAQMHHHTKATTAKVYNQLNNNHNQQCIQCSTVHAPKTS